MLRTEPPPNTDGPTGDAPLRGRHALITGAGRGIGRAVAESLAALGAELTLIGRNPEPLGRAAAEIGLAGGLVPRALAADVTDDASLAAAFGRARHEAGRITILINNAGIAESAPFARTGLDMWRSTLDTNLTGTFRCTRLAWSEMIENGWGRIVNIASTAGLKGYGYTSAYCASKHGVVGLTRALALEAARTGVTVNAVCPGFTDTDMVSRAADNIAAKTGRPQGEARAALAAANPQGRLVDPQEVAEAVAWLCLPSSASITGQAIAVAGGEVM